MNKTDIIISYFRLNEKERKEQFAAESSAQIIKSGRFAAGSAHFAVLEDNGTVKAYGDNSFGQCNTKGWTNVKKVVAGDFHTAALTNDGKVYATGDNSFGQCCVEPWHNIEELFADKKLTVGITKEGAILASHKRADKTADKPKEQPEKSGELKSKEKNTIGEIKKTLPESNGTFEYIDANGRVIITKYLGKSEKISIPDRIKDSEVVSIGTNAFANNLSLRWVKFPESLKIINSMAFVGCSNLEYISFPSGLETIKDLAFAYCNLKSLNIPESVKHIGNYAFMNCEKLVKVSIPDNIETIMETAFSGCNNIEFDKKEDIKSKGYKKTLDGTFEYTEIDGKIQITKYFGDSENVIIPEKVKGMEVDSIGENAFTNNSSVKWVKFPESIREINCKAFIGCSGLEYISIPFGLETIKDYAFAYCNLKSLNLPESLKYIGNYAFLNNERLKGISIPNSIETIEDTAFRGCNTIEILEITPYAKQRIKNYTQIFNLK